MRSATFNSIIYSTNDSDINWIGAREVSVEVGLKGKIIFTLDYTEGSVWSSGYEIKITDVRAMCELFSFWEKSII